MAEHVGIGKTFYNNGKDSKKTEDVQCFEVKAGEARLAPPIRTRTNHQLFHRPATSRTPSPHIININDHHLERLSLPNKWGCLDISTRAVIF